MWIRRVKDSKAEYKAYMTNISLRMLRQEDLGFEASLSNIESHIFKSNIRQKFLEKKVGSF